ncbi:anti-sigma factor family protein [Celeribacter neptunius]|uniref:Transmembrane transcriptional regulator (Anti-sigma factor RsiW) n=1 Tax=Celeribacter neptunius TaxID=588602 RepID=A0A1I3REF1_9RHOB|nr:anti-sigma factor [Celeribacter neptunius]SFJ44668.1 Transmembrane transcriptional regulator (anti-sigma factor RsiW) [Celeribacter neptunius]
MSDTMDIDIHRYVDGEMTREEALAFERRMEEDETLATRVAQVMTDMAALKAAFPTPPAGHFDTILEAAEAAVEAAAISQTPARAGWGWQQIAAGLALLALGFGAGNLTRGSAPTDLAGDVLAEASAAHELYAVEVVHPVEVPASERDHLKGWLSNRLGAEVRIPDLNQNGLSLVGGRLLPFEQGAAAQFMYEDGEGTRVTLYLTPVVDRQNTALRHGEKDALSMVYWQDGAWLYALVGPFDKTKMTGLARQVQGELF